ncbi:MAG: 2-C-methyl-D-erythritol 4-phosphate cytidylyltransferase [Clostridiales bacterium]|nr:2-C-methyl-D-erythritol 4-phosphate cytidylyltransferase [Clostridiales bacterium]
MKTIKYETRRNTSAIIVAAGQSSRMSNFSSYSKQFIVIGDKPVLAHVLNSFYLAKTINEIIVVVRENDIGRTNNLVKEFEMDKITSIVSGGVTRQESVRFGLEEIKDDVDFVVIHDGARPFITPGEIDEIVSYSFKGVSATFGIQITDTVKFVKKGSDGLMASNVPAKKEIWKIQTPQVFPYYLIKLAHEKAKEKKFFATDDCTLVENLGEYVHVLKGSKLNIKITYPDDLVQAKLISKIVKL